MTQYHIAKLVPAMVTILVVLIPLAQQGCQSDVVPVTDYRSERVNTQATELKRKCVFILHEALTSGNQTVRLKAAVGLSAVRDQKGIENAIALMSGRNKEKGLRVASYFARNGLTPTTAALSDASVTARRSKGTLKELAIAALGKSPRRESLQSLKSMWQGHDEQRVRVAAASSLARQSHAEAINWLLSNTRGWLNYGAFDSHLFARIATDEALDNVAAAIRVGASNSVRNAIMAAETTKDSRFSQVLPVLIARKHGSIQVMAATVLAEMRGSEGLNVLRNVFDKKMMQFPLAVWAAMGLANVEDETGLLALNEYLEKEMTTRRGIDAASLILPCLNSPGNAVSDSFECWIACQQ